MTYDSNYQTDQERLRRQQGMPIQEQPDAMSTNEELLQKAESDARAALAASGSEPPTKGNNMSDLDIDKVHELGTREEQ